MGGDTWGVDYVLLDKDDAVIGDAFCYRNQRTEAVVPQVHHVVSFEKLYGRTGIQSANFNTVYQLFCDKISGRLETATNFLMLPDYFNFRLTVMKRQEYTNATTTGMVNAKTRAWDKDIIERLGLPTHLFDTLSQPGTVVGELTDEVAAKVGYRAKVILPATHDTASAVLADLLKRVRPTFPATRGRFSVWNNWRRKRAPRRGIPFGRYSDHGYYPGRARNKEELFGDCRMNKERAALRLFLSFFVKILYSGNTV